MVDGEALVMGGEGLVDTGAIGLASWKNVRKKRERRSTHLLKAWVQVWVGSQVLVQGH